MLPDRKGDPKQPSDPYMTLVGHFNSLRELGGMRRLEPHPWAATETKDVAAAVGEQTPR